MPAQLLSFSYKSQLKMSSLRYVIDVARPARSSDYILHWLNTSIGLNVPGQPPRALGWRVEEGMNHTKEVCEIILPLVDQMVTDYGPGSNAVGCFSVQVKPALHNASQHTIETLLAAVREVQCYVERTDPLPGAASASAEHRAEALMP